jgi:hypothetical protein
MFVQDHIGSLNFNYKVQLRSAKVDYINAYAEFAGDHKIKVPHLFLDFLHLVE